MGQRTIDIVPGVAFFFFFFGSVVWKAYNGQRQLDIWYIPSVAEYSLSLARSRAPNIYILSYILEKFQ